MCVSVENALKLAILQRPEWFGLLPEDVNPLLRFVLKAIEGDDEDSSMLASACFEECNGVLYQKVIELLKVDVVRGARQKPEAAEAKAERPTEEAKASAGGSKLSVKQLRYLGYLHRQLGEEPDYKAIGKLTQKQATMRIRELEQQLGVASEA